MKIARGLMGGWLAVYTWRYGIAAVVLTPRPLFRWQHGYWAGLSRHSVYAGWLGAEWAYKPRSVTEEQCAREQMEALAGTVRDAVDKAEAR